LTEPDPSGHDFQPDPTLCGSRRCTRCELAFSRWSGDACPRPTWLVVACFQFVDQAHLEEFRREHVDAACSDLDQTEPLVEVEIVGIIPRP
jgi:hypothetical protein